MLGALCAGATDRFYIEDFTINPEETIEVGILLDNEVAYSAFQADLYLPTGLTIVQEDGDYLIDLTTRKGRDHTISSKLHADGGIRIMSYSTSLKVYSGNNGVLVTMCIAADEDFTGPATIRLKNVLFTAPLGEEIEFAGETCIVTLPTTSTPGDINGDGTVSISDITALIDYLLSGDDTNIQLDNADVDCNGTVSVSDVTALIDKLLSGN